MGSIKEAWAGLRPSLEVRPCNGTLSGHKPGALFPLHQFYKRGSECKACANARRTANARTEAWNPFREWPLHNHFQYAGPIAPRGRRLGKITTPDKGWTTG